MKRISPVTFVKPNVIIEAKFIDEDGDEYRWYTGKVTRVHKVVKSKFGNYVDCDIEYEDDEKVNHSILHDQDFEEEDSEDAWRFEEAWSKLVKLLVEKDDEIEHLRSDIQDLLEICAEEEDETEEESSYDSEEEEYCESVAEAVPRKCKSHYLLAPLAIVASVIGAFLGNVLFTHFHK
jgi:hypothetical protein